MSRNINSVSSEDTESHGRLYNFFARLGEKLDNFYDKVFGDEVICDKPELPFSSSMPGDVQPGPVGAHEKNTGKKAGL